MLLLKFKNILLSYLVGRLKIVVVRKKALSKMEKTFLLSSYLVTYSFLQVIDYQTK